MALKPPRQGKTGINSIKSTYLLVTRLREECPQRSEGVLGGKVTYFIDGGCLEMVKDLLDLVELPTQDRGELDQYIELLNDSIRGDQEQVLDPFLGLIEGRKRGKWTDCRQRLTTRVLFPLLPAPVRGCPVVEPYTCRTI
jgi:hypothetical protein